MTRDLLRERGLRWITRNRDRFTLATAGNRLAGIKLLGELALTAELLARRAEHAAAARALLDFAWAQLGEGNVLADAAPEAPGVTSIYTSFHRTGYANARVVALLDDAAWLASIPRIPLQLPVALARRDVGLSERWSIDELYTHTSVLPRHPPPGSLTELLAYTLTHTAFQMTTFGTDASAIPTPDRDYLARTLDTWIAVYLERRNVDLVAEFVMTAHCVDLCCEAKVWDCLAEVQTDDGDLVPFSPQPLPEDPRERFLAVLHPTLVAVMASAMCHHG